MRFHTDPHIDLLLREARAGRMCADGAGEFLNTLFGNVAPVAGELADVGGGIAPILGELGSAAPLIADGVGTTIPGIVDNTMSSGLLDALHSYQGIDPGLLAGGVLDASGALNLSGLINNSGGGISLPGGGSLTGLLGGAGKGGTGGVQTDIPGSTGSKAPTVGGTSFKSPSPTGVGGPSPFDTGTKIDNNLTTGTPATPTLTGSSALTAPTPAAALPAAAAGATAAPKAAADTGGLGGISGFMRQNAPLLSLGALGASALMPKAAVPNLDKMQAGADAAGKTATELMSSLTSGKLPAGAENGIQDALAANIAGIKSNYAGMGLSGSTMERQDIAKAQRAAETMRFDMAKQLTETGLNAAGLSENIWAQIAQLVLQDDSSLQDALASFAQAMAYGSGVTPRVT